MKDKQLAFIKSLYNKGENIMSFLRGQNNKNSTEAILISYDFQAGTYIQYTNNHPDFNSNYTKHIAQTLADFAPSSILEVGVGEATTLANVLAKMEDSHIKSYGFDLSWSRIKYAYQYVNTKELKQSVFLSTGDLFQMPYLDNSIDIVYTSHSIEPNGGREKEALEELYRVAKKYVILLEPAYELANKEARQRMKNNGYVTSLHSTALSLGYKVLEYRLFDYCANPLNPTGLMIIEKSTEKNAITHPLACPVTRTSLSFDENAYFSKSSLLAYPILHGVPCLTPDDAIVATKFLNF
ncbi:methyltransferase domain-containing protein [Microscilla marina]|uniref:Methyltransferase domain-containing protein n=1 Tax=Microscilla marina ATCC 23134 TaxID=313606 RepID=A1ZCK1_MICM2|nr:methyltransferase domain-containing protein [Microscilla marina]EAY32003.1 hypothetical protein M23134_02032 [Microscilla marina ATCC 23134]